MLRSPRVQLQKAEKLVGKGKLEAALKIYEKVLQDEQNDTGTLNKAGDLYVRLHRIDKAIELFSRTAGFFIEEQLFVKAIAIYKKILRLDPNRLEIAKKLADTYISQGLINDATRQYGEIAAQYMRQGDVETALAVHHKMVGVLPKDPSARLRYAELLEEHGKLKESMSQYRQLAQVLLEEGGAVEAIKVLLRGVQVLPERLEYIEQVSGDLLKSGGEEAALSFLTQATEYNSAAKNVNANPGGGHSASSQPTVLSEEGSDTVDEVVEIGDLIEPVTPTKPSLSLAPVSQASLVDPEMDFPELSAAEDSDDLVFELDMTDLETDFSVEAPALKPLVGTPKLDADVKLAEIIKEQAVKPDPDVPVRVLSDREKRVAELVNEAEVLTRFGMDEKAAERLDLALIEDSTHLVTFDRLITCNLKLGRMDKIPSLANRMSVAADEQEVPQSFATVLERVVEAGFKFEHGEFFAPPSNAGDEADLKESSEMLDRGIDKVVDDLVTQLAKDQPTPPGEDQHTISEDIAAVTWLGEDSVVEAVLAEVDLVLPTEVAAVEEVEVVVPTKKAAKPPSDLIDIAEELMRELEDEDEQQDQEEEPDEAEDDRILATVVTEEESLEDIVRGFRQGVDATLSPEDYDTHFNLGIAYREMGLIDEAIGEFQLASKDSRYLIKGCSLLALSYLDKGLPGLAMNAYQLALESETATEMESIGLRYEIGDLYLTMGDPEAAREYFVEIYGTDSKYRDVAQKLNEIERAL